MMNSIFQYDYDHSSIIKIKPKNFDFDFFITPRFTHHYVNEIYEKSTSFLLQVIARNLTTFVDIGAHYGFFNVLIGRANPDCKIIAFEPIEENFAILNKNLNINNINAKLLNKAVSNVTGQAVFEVSEASDNSGFRANPNAKLLQTINVETVRLDDFISELKGDSLLIKIDVEGSEIDVLEGMDSIIKRHDNLRLIIEFNPKCIVLNKYEPQQLLNLLNDKGFVVFFIEEDCNLYFKYQHGTSWRDLIREDQTCNLFCVKQKYDLNLLFFSHSSLLAGAQKSLIQLVKELTGDYGAICSVVLPDQGPSEKLLQEAGASTIIAPINWWCSDTEITDVSYINNKNAQSFEWIINNLDLIKRINPDIILTNTLVFPWGAAAAMLMKKPHVWMVNEFGQLDHNLNFYIPFEEVINFITKTSELIVTNSNSVKKTLFSEVNNVNVQKIYRHIELERSIKLVSNENKKWFTHKDSTHIMIIGSIQESKGQKDAILAVIDLIKKRQKKVELIIIGYADPKYKSSLEDIIFSENIGDYIQIVKFQENIITIVNEADIILVCSKMEAFGRVTLEAMLLQKPVIATNTGGTPELISDGETGLLYTPGDYMQLADQIEKLIKNPDLGKQMALKAYCYANKTFTKENFGGQYFSMLRELKNQDFIIKDESGKFLFNQFQNLIQEKNKSLQSLTFDLDERDNAIQRLEQEVIFYATSKSWAITRPIRKIVKFSKSLFRNDN